MNSHRKINIVIKIEKMLAKFIIKDIQIKTILNSIYIPHQIVKY